VVGLVGRAPATGVETGTTLFAALDVLTGTVIGRCLPRHRNTGFLRSLRTIDREVPKGLAIHMILDNEGTHKQAGVKAWAGQAPAKHPRLTCMSLPPPRRG